MKQPLFIRQRNEDGSLGPLVKAFEDQETPEEILARENKELRQRVEAAEKALLSMMMLL